MIDYSRPLYHIPTCLSYDSLNTERESRNYSYAKNVIFNQQTSRSFSHSWLITRFITRFTRLVPLVKQELVTLTEHLSSHLGFSGVRVTRSLVLYVCFVDRCLSFCTFSFGYCVVCSSIYRFWLLLCLY